MELPKPDGRVLRIGHRGAAALAPENTLRSIESALELGVDWIEFDVLDVRDGSLVLAHSSSLREVSHGAARGRVRRRTVDELRVVAPELPTLDDALALVAERAPGVFLHLDLKWHGYEEAVLEAIDRHGLRDRTYVGSFFRKSLIRFAALDAGVTRALSYPGDKGGLSRLKGVAPGVAAALSVLRATLPRRIDGWLALTGASIASFHYGVLSRAALQRCHARGVAVVVWTVDDPAYAKRLEALGVDGIITNDPRIFDLSET